MPPTTIATPNPNWWLKASARVSTSSLMALSTVRVAKTGKPHRSGEPGMVDDVGKREEMHEPRESEIALAAVEHAVRVLPQPRRKAEGVGAHDRRDRDDREASGEEPRVVGDTAAP